MHGEEGDAGGESEGVVGEGVRGGDKAVAALEGGGGRVLGVEDLDAAEGVSQRIAAN